LTIVVGMRVKDVLGRFGEDLAARRLTDAGYEILSRNWRCADGELDIVARDGTTLAFIEVKTRSSVAFGSPAEAVTPVKAARIRRLALRWLMENRDSSAEFWPVLRFDVVSVLRRRDGPPLVDHYIDAF
jgi:putative endonuclease